MTLIINHIIKQNPASICPPEIFNHLVALRVPIWTLERGLGNAFTPQVERAWGRVYLLIAATMQAGADEVSTMQAAE